MSGQTLIIACVIGTYLGVMVLTGILSRRFVTTSDDFFRGRKSVPWQLAGLSLYMGSFTAVAFVAFGSVVYNQGTIGLLLGYGSVAGWIVLGIVFARLWHRAELVTPLEYLERRFGPGTREMTAWVLMVIGPIANGLRLYALAVILHTVLDVPLLFTILLSGAIVLTYTWIGGLWAVVLTHSLQFIVLLMGLIPLVILSISAAGGIAALPDIMASEAVTFSRGDLGWSWLVTWWLLEFIQALFSLEGIQRFSSVPTERDAKKTALLTAALIIPTPLLALTPIVICRYLFPGVSGEAAFAHIAMQVLPAGLLGMMIGSMVAATLSNLDSAINIDSGILTRDLYHRLFNPNATEARLLAVSRLTTAAITVVITGIAAGIALSQVGMFSFIEALNSRVLVILCIPFVLGILLRQPSAKGFLFACGVGAAVSLASWLAGRSAGDSRLPIIIATTIAMLISSRVMRPNAADVERSVAFFADLRIPKPADPAETAASAGTTAPMLALATLLLASVPAALALFVEPDGLGRVIEGVIAVLLLMLSATFHRYGARARRSRKANLTAALS